ncbi:dual specificity protein kinase yak1 [Coemansia sp. RSA 1250]|nr:dual specificity protein kinase yak1 [Coemansia sp. RSA 1250]
MEYTGRNPRNGNMPMAVPPASLGASYVYNGYMEQNRGTESDGESSPALAGVQNTGHNNHRIRPMSMFAHPATTNPASSPYMAPSANAPLSADQQHAMSAPNTATSDRSFHAIMIGDSNHTPSRALPNSTANAAPLVDYAADTQIQAKQRGDAGRSGSMVDTAAVSSGSPYLQSEFSQRSEAAGQGYSRLMYPPLGSNNSFGVQPLPALSSTQHTRTSSYHHSPLQPDPAAAQAHSLAAPSMPNIIGASASLHNPSNGQPLSRQALEPVYQALSLGTASSANANTSAAQLYPVSQPGLPPPGPASATLSMYASVGHSPMVGRERSRRKHPHYGYDYPEASSADRISPSSPVVAHQSMGSQLPPLMRQTMSTNNASEYGSSAALRHQLSSEFAASPYSQQQVTNSGYNSPGISPSMGMQMGNASAASVALPASGAYTYSRVYNYPEVGYSPQQQQEQEQEHAPRPSQRTTSAAWSDKTRPESIMDVHGSSDSDLADAAAMGSDNVTASMSSDNTQSREYAGAAMSHIRWNPATSSGSPLRQEISMAEIAQQQGPGHASNTLPQLSVATSDNTSGHTLAHIYGTLPRTGYAERGSAEAQETANSSPGQQQQQQQRPWPRASTEQLKENQASAGSLSDHYALASPSDQTFGEPQTPHADSTSLLPMVEVAQSTNAPSATNMDEINAHSQEYLHRRRRRLTQTMHNRQRSGSAADPAARLSASRMNLSVNMSSPSAHSFTSNRSTEEARISAEQGTHPSMQSAAGPYTNTSASYLSPSVQMSMQVQAQMQAQAQAQLQAQARAQAEYMQRLQMAEQERLQQEQMRLALEQQQIKMAQEQELLRFRNYRPLLNMTVDIVDTYRKCHSEFYYESARRPRRVLTHPSDGVKNDGFDNENSDYILYVNDVIGEREGHQYLILEMLGSGTFGQVVKCQNIKTGEFVAVKVIKNKTAYYNQSLMEVQMLDLLNKKFDIDDRHHILRLKEWFVFRNHLVFVNELLSINLYDLLKQNQYQGLSTNLVRVLVQQILDAMIVLNKAQIIHADLKPENILLEGMEKPVIKVIDFGSACFEWQTVFTYIQSRFYRSPEILLGLPYSSRIDMWSLGCIVAELYLGLPLFPGSSEYNQLSRIVDLLGVPPRNMLEKARRTDEFFNYLGPGTWDLKPMEQFSRERNTEEKESKRYFSANTLEELITTYPIRRRVTDAEQQREYQSRIALIDFLRGLLQLDPDRRWSPQQASMHPFITGEPFVGPFVPQPLSHDPHNSSGASGSYGPLVGGSGAQQSMHHGSGGGYGRQAHTIGYSANPYTGGAGSNGYAAQPTYAGSAATSLFSHAPSPPSAVPQAAEPAKSQDTAGLTWAHHTHRSSLQSNSNGFADAGQASIPGAFPVNQDDRNSLHSLNAEPHSSNYGNRGRARATTLGHASGLAQSNSMAAQPNAGHSYQQTEIPGSFLGVDPSASQKCGLQRTTDSEPRDVPGRLEINNSEGNVSHGWASISETNYNYPSSNTGSNGTRTGSLYENQVDRSYYERQQQQRLLQQRRLYQSEYESELPSGPSGIEDAADCSMSPRQTLGLNPLQANMASTASSMAAPDHFSSADKAAVVFAKAKPLSALLRNSSMRLVSNFSPLTLPSSPGSSTYSRRYASSSAVGERCSAEPELVERLADLDACPTDDDDSSCFSEHSGMSQLLTQGPGSETSLSLYSAISDEGDFEPSTSRFSAASHGFSEALNTHLQPFPIPQTKPSQQVFGMAKHSSLPYSLDKRLAEASSSIYLSPRYAAYSQDVLNSTNALHGKDNLQLPNVSVGNNCSSNESVVSQDMDGRSLESSLNDLADASDADYETSSSSLAGQSKVLFDYISDLSDSSDISDHDKENSQDTVLYVGKQRSHSGSARDQSLLGTPQLRQNTQDIQTIADRARASLEALQLSPSPIPQSVRSTVTAAHPLKIMKKSQQERVPTQAKDSLRMVESLRRMGKWQNFESVRAARDLSRANQFFYDPVIISISPRLLPQSGQSS